ncbi:Rmf/CrpP family protein [Ralstonia insidiosa]|uniref:Ribosome modulation factor n=1 Tax=Ralstonia insidiosa TaxID=190721 RepID=A0A848NWA8_9RALS|nr:Rmf/CrpP family protein [Ralstonia insidiosa]NMV37223.1 hypothetical protein [Ralstonia insidiosa]
MQEVFQTRANVRAQGAEAYRQGKPMSDCPYQEYTCAHREWVEAYDAERIGAEQAAAAHTAEAA